MSWYKAGTFSRCALSIVHCARILAADLLSTSCASAAKTISATTRAIGRSAITPMITAVMFFIAPTFVVQPLQARRQSGRCIPENRANPHNNPRPQLRCNVHPRIRRIPIFGKRTVRNTPSRHLPNRAVHRTRCTATLILVCSWPPNRRNRDSDHKQPEDGAGGFEFHLASTKSPFSFRR